MPIATRMLALHRAIGQATIKADASVCQYRLAARAHACELRDGKVLSPDFTQWSSYLPFHAAKPVAPLIGGSRRAGYAAAAQWGASCAVSAVRTDLPLLTCYFVAYLKEYVPAAPPAAPPHRGPNQPPPTGTAGLQPPHRGKGLGRAGTEEEADVEAQAERPEKPSKLAWLQAHLEWLPYVPLAFAGWEAVLGKGTRSEVAGPAGQQEAAYGVDQLPTFEIMRRVGVLGLGEAVLLAAAAAASQRGHCRTEVLILAVAVGVRLGLAPLRLVSVLPVAAVALCGAGFGVAVEGLAGAVFAWRQTNAERAGRRAEVMDMAEAELLQAQRLAEAFREFGPAELSAPLAKALLQARLVDVVASANWWTASALGAAAGYRLCKQRPLGFLPDLVPEADRSQLHLLAMQVIFARAARGGGRPPPPAVPVPPEGQAGGPPPAAAGARPAQGAAPDYVRGVDVHDPGRDLATRQGIMVLLRQYPQVDVPACLADLRQAIHQHEVGQTALARRRHDHPGTGTLLEAARRALGEPGSRAPGFPEILRGGTAHAIALDMGQRVSLRQLCATVWHCINQLRSGRGEPFTEVLRAERRDAFIAALADCINEFGERVCGPGQSQRMMLVLQGSVPGVQIETLDRTPTVAEYVTYVYPQMAADLGDEPTEAQVHLRYQRAYAEGKLAVPAAMHERLRRELAALVQIEYNFNWQPEP